MFRLQARDLSARTRTPSRRARSGIRGGLDHLLHLFFPPFAEHFIAFEGRDNVGAAVDAPDRFDHLGIEYGDPALGNVHRGVADKLGGGDSAFSGRALGQFSLQIGESDRLRPPRVGPFVPIVRASCFPIPIVVVHGFLPHGRDGRSRRRPLPKRRAPTRDCDRAFNGEWRRAFEPENVFKSLID